jgi:dTDP-4-amino-4,6-dideoxygalactose transaminase
VGFRLGCFPEAEAYYEDAISLPIYATLDETQQDEVVEALKIALQA